MYFCNCVSAASLQPVAYARGRHFGPLLEDGVLEVERLPAVDGREPGYVNDHVARFLDHIPSIHCPLDRSGHAQTLIHGKQRALCLLQGARSIFVASGDLLPDDGGLPQELGEVFGGFHAVGRERGLDVAVGGDGLVLPITGLRGFQLVDVLAHQVALDAVPGQKSQRFLQDFKFAQARELVQHHQQAMLIDGLGAPLLELDAVRQQSDDHVEQNADKRAQSRLVGGPGNDVETHRIGMVHQIGYPEMRIRSVVPHHRIPIQRQVGLGGGQDGSCLFPRPVHHVARGGGNDALVRPAPCRAISPGAVNISIHNSATSRSGSDSSASISESEGVALPLSCAW